MLCRCIPESEDPCKLSVCEQNCSVYFGRIICTCFSGYRFNALNHKNGIRPVCEGMNFVKFTYLYYIHLPALHFGYLILREVDVLTNNSHNRKAKETTLLFGVCSFVEFLLRTSLVFWQITKQQC